MRAQDGVTGSLRGEDAVQPRIAKAEDVVRPRHFSAFSAGELSKAGVNYMVWCSFGQTLLRNASNHDASSRQRLRAGWPRACYPSWPILGTGADLSVIYLTQPGRRPAAELLQCCTGTQIMRCIP
jgi:hypothetical protein